MTKPYGLLRCGFPYVKTLGMRRLTNYPVDMALGKEGRMYILSKTDNAASIRRYNYDDEDLGTIGAMGREEGQFTWPASIITDDDENIYVSDEALDRISTFDMEGEFKGAWGESGDGDGRLNRPSGMAFDGDGNILVSDTLNHRVQKFTKDGKFLMAFGSFGDGEGQFNMPWGLTVDDEGAVYVADWRNDRVQKFTADGEFVFALGTSGNGDGEFNRPTDVAVDGHGDIYVCDWGNDRVQMFNPEPRYVQKFLGDATLSKIAREYMLTNASPNRMRDMANLEPAKYLRRPKSVTIDDDGKLFITDNKSYRIQVYQKEVIELTPQQFGAPLRSPTLNQE